MAYEEQPLNADAAIPSSSGGSKEFKNHKIASGDNIYRIMPPFGTNNGGSPFAEIYLHWFQDPSGRNRPLSCAKKIERYCPVCESANEVYKRLEVVLNDYKDEAGKVNFKALAMNDEDNAKSKNLRAQFDALKAQRGFYYNAMDSSGTIGVLRLPKTAAEALGEKIRDGINVLGMSNPLSLRNGVLFNIVQKKTGKDKRDVEYSVDFVRESKDTPEGIVQIIKKSAVPDNVIANFEKLAYDIHAMYPARTSQELKRVMMGDKKVWDEIDAKRNSNGNGRAVAVTESVGEAPATVATPTATAQPAPSTPAIAAQTTTPAAPKSAVTSDAEVARLRAELGLPS